MEGGLLFVSQALLDTWATQGRIGLDGQSIRLLTGQGEGRRYALEPAARFIRVAEGGADLHQLVARVKTLAQIREMGGEAMSDSVLLGEVAYEIEPGFLAEGSVVEAARGSNARDLEERRQEAQALARFLLDNLS